MSAAPPARHSPPARAIFTAEQLSFLLHRERSRAERLGHEFAIVLFEAPHGWIEPADGKRLGALLNEHLRITDDFGWYDTRRMCAVLPGTNAEGAHRFAERVGETLDAAGLPLTRSIYLYPSRWFGATLDNEPTPPANDRDGRNDRDDHDDSGPGGRGGHRARIEASVARSLRKPATPPAPVHAHALEQAFAKPMPWWKRMIDIVGAAIAIAAFSPVFIVAALAVKLTSPGPVIFTQARSGIGGKAFRMYKFRTMVVDAEAKQAALRSLSEQDGPAFKIKNDPRITRVGGILRKTSIDELPQLFNILLGDMSLVGPRPLPIKESDACDQWHRARLDVTPGLTCIWQVNGRSTTNFDRWVRMDLEYIRKRSVWFDLKLIFMTVPAVLLQRGAR